MTEKSIGGFIAALRKANGLTQKQLAEKLNVSDKAISRWEREECAPDITLIPVMAEIFGVTSDEILRGERRPAGEEPPVVGDRQVERLVAATLTRFSVRGMLTLGLAGGGLMVAAIANFGFDRATVGFLVACAFYLAAVVCLAVYTRLSFGALEVDHPAVNTARGRLFASLCRYSIALLIFVAVTLPFGYLPYDPYVGIGLNWWLEEALNCAIVAALLSAVLVWVAKRLAVAAGLYTVSAEEKSRSHRLDRLRGKYLLILVPIWLVTFLAQAMFNSACTNSTFAKGEEFTSFAEFKAYMETPDTADDDGEFTDLEELEPGEEEELSEEVFYAADGRTVLGTYVHRRQSVMEISFNWEEDTPIITTYTGAALQAGGRVLDAINIIWVAAYVAEMLVVYLAYRKNSKLTLDE